MAARRGGSRSLGCHGYLPALPSIASGPHQLSGHDLPSSSIGDEFNFLINKQNATFVDLIPISLDISAILNLGIIKISKTTSIILHLIIIVSVM